MASHGSRVSYTVYHFLVGGGDDAIKTARDVLLEYTRKSAAGEKVTDFTFEFFEGEAAWGGAAAGGERVLSITATYNASRFSDPASVDEDAQKLQAELKRRTGNAAIPLTTHERCFVTW